MWMEVYVHVKGRIQLKTNASPWGHSFSVTFAKYTCCVNFATSSTSEVIVSVVTRKRAYLLVVWFHPSRNGFAILAFLPTRWTLLGWLTRWPMAFEWRQDHRLTQQYTVLQRLHVSLQFPHASKVFNQPSQTFSVLIYESISLLCERICS